MFIQTADNSIEARTPGILVKDQSVWSLWWWRGWARSPVVGATPGVAGRGGLLPGPGAGSGPVAGLGLSGPVLGHLRGGERENILETENISGTAATTGPTTCWTSGSADIKTSHTVVSWSPRKSSNINMWSNWISNQVNSSDRQTVRQDSLYLLHITLLNNGAGVNHQEKRVRKKHRKTNLWMNEHYFNEVMEISPPKNLICTFLLFL